VTYSMLPQTEARPDEVRSGSEVAAAQARAGAGRPAEPERGLPCAQARGQAEPSRAPEGRARREHRDGGAPQKENMGGERGKQ